MPMPDELRSAPPATLDVPICRTLDAQVAVRAEGDAGGMPTMTGHFSVFDSWYEINSFWEGNFLERTVKGAFKKTMKERKSGGETPIRVLLEHGMDLQVNDKPLGVPTRLEEDDHGPSYDVPLFDTSYNRDLVPALEAGAYGSSFRFQVLRDEWNEEPEPSDYNPKGIPERTVKEVRVIEFGPTVFPASPAATAGVRSTTDEFYQHLKRRAPEQYDEALKRTTSIRTPARPATAAVDEPTPAATGTEVETAERTAAPPAGAAPATTDEPRKHSEATPPTQATRSTTVTDIMSVEERVARQEEIRARLAEIDTEHSGAALPEEIRAEWDDLNTEHDEHETAITEARSRQDRIRALSSAGGTSERGAVQVQNSRRKVENIYDLAEIRRQARSIDEMPQLYRDNAMRAVETARYPGATDRAAAQTQVERLLDTVDDKDATIARRILVTGSPVYERAFGKYATSLSTNGLTAEEQRALAVGAGATGGFAVPFQLDPTVILTNNGSLNPLRQIARVEQITGKEWDGIASAGVTVARAAESAQSSDNAPTLAQPTVKAERVQGFIPYSIETEMDWAGMQSEMTRLLADAKDNEEATAFVTGTGVSPDANGLIQTLNASSNVTANTFTVASLYALEEALPDRFLDNAKFLAHRSVYNLARQFDTAGGANLWVRLGESQPPELLGYPAYRTSAMPDGTLAINDKYLLLGDFRHFLIVDRVGMMVDVVPHLFGANQRPTGQRGLYAMWRNNSKILTDAAFRVLFKAA